MVAEAGVIPFNATEQLPDINLDRPLGLEFADALSEYALAQSSLLRFANRLCHYGAVDGVSGEDLLSIVIQRIYSKAEKEPGKVQDIKNIDAFLNTGVVNAMRSVWRHQVVVDKNKNRVHASASDIAHDFDQTSEQAILMREHQLVQRAIRNLPPRQREVIVLRYYGGLSETEIASAMGISNGAVKSHASKAMSAMFFELSFLLIEEELI
ncbi:MAG TPA: sigma-70 family RNA polymerase sigma factor [Candidatus Saccharimonadales bacterium]|nr:sigma-70 family RNA polymerase sigma factor [Candidatus Saccharimonadales bacterium]